MSSRAKNLPSPMLTTAISMRSTTKRRASPSGMSATLATSISIELLLDAGLQAGLDLGQRDSVQHLLEEPPDDQPLSLAVLDAPALQVEQRLLVDRPHAGRVATADGVVRDDLQVRNGLGLGRLREQDVA